MFCRYITSLGKPAPASSLDDTWLEWESTQLKVRIDAHILSNFISELIILVRSQNKFHGKKSQYINGLAAFGPL